MKTYDLMLPFTRERVTLTKSTYVNNQTRLEFTSIEDYCPVATITIGIQDKLPKYCIAVKNYSENIGMVDELVRLGIVESNPVMFTKGHNPVYKLTNETITDLNMA